MSVVVVFLVMPRNVARALGRGFLRPRDDGLLEHQVHEQDHRLGLQDQRSRGFHRIGVEVLMHAVHVHDRHVPGRPVVAHAVVDLVALAVEDVERSLVHVAVLLRPASRAVFLQMHVERLRHPVHRLDEVLAEGLRAVVEEQVLALDHARQAAQARELVLQAVLSLDPAHEDAVLLAAVVRFLAHGCSVSSIRPLKNASEGSGFPRPQFGGFQGGAAPFYPLVYRPLPKISSYSFTHLSYSSSVTRASTNFSGSLLSGVSIFLFVGTKSRCARIFWPSSLISKS